MNILVRLPNWLGDICMSMYFLDALSRVYPDSRVDVIIKEQYKDIFLYYKKINRVYSFTVEDKSFLSIVKFGMNISKQNKYDLYFALPKSFSSAVTGVLAGCKIRVGYRYEARNFLLTNSYRLLKNIHRVDEYLNLLSMFANKKIILHKFKLGIRKRKRAYLPDKFTILMNINSEASSREIPIHYAEKIIRTLKSKYDVCIALTGVEKDLSKLDALFERLSDVSGLYNLAGKTTMAELVILVNEADMVFSTDSGIAHLADLLGKPEIVIFGAGDKKNTAPYNLLNNSIVLTNENISCSPCVENICKFGSPECITSINEEKILVSMRQLVDRCKLKPKVINGKE